MTKLSFDQVAEMRQSIEKLSDADVRGMGAFCLRLFASRKGLPLPDAAAHFIQDIYLVAAMEKVAAELEPKSGAGNIDE